MTKWRRQAALGESSKDSLPAEMPTSQSGNLHRIGTWNVRSLNGREQELIGEMKRYDLGVLGVSETRWKGNGAKSIDNCYVIFSGVSDGRARAGVAVFLSEEMSRCVRSWQCVNERIVVVKLKVVGGEWLTLVQVYAPTNDSGGEVKEHFYNKLQKVTEKVGRKETLIIMGDLNARVGKDSEVWGSVIGRHGEAVRNESGEQLLRFCAVNEMLVANSWYQHREIHKYTWVCPGRELRSIIDYFLVRKGDRVRVNDVRVVRGAEIGSDHHLVLLKISKMNRGGRHRKVEESVRIRTDRLKDRCIRLKFEKRLKQKMSIRGQRVSHREESSEEVWAEFKEGILSTAVEVCGVRRHNGQRKRTRWWNEEVKEAVRKKKVAYMMWLQRKTLEAKDEYHRAKKEAKRVVRIAQNEEWMELGRSLQSDFQNNQRRFWRRVRAPKRGSQEVDKICDGNGQVIGEEDGVMERWKEYFSGLLQGGRKRRAQRKL